MFLGSSLLVACFGAGRFAGSGLDDFEFHGHEDFMCMDKFDVAASIQVKASGVFTAQAQRQQRS